MALHGRRRILERNPGRQVHRSVPYALYARLASLLLGWHHQQHSGDVQQCAPPASQALASLFVYLQNLVNVLGRWSRRAWRSSSTRAKWCAVDLLR